MDKVDQDQILPCDFCKKKMTFHDYTTHRCEALQGRNPWDEKMAKAKWKVPGVKGTISARGRRLERPVRKPSIPERFLDWLIPPDYPNG